MIVDGHDQLETLYECLLTILANVSPYVKAIGMVTSNKLMHLFKLLSRPRFLFANERNHRYVFFLLEVQFDLPLGSPFASYFLLSTGLQQFYSVSV